MPPKAPNLKFKPKLVLRDEGASGHSSATQAAEDLSLVQLARLQGLYIEEPASSSGAVASTGDRLAPLSSSSAHTGGGGGSGGAAGSSSSAGRGLPHQHSANVPSVGEGSQAAAGSSLLRPKGRGHNLSAHAALEEASRRHVDISQYPEVAPELPHNSMNTIVLSNASRDDASMHSGIYAPLPVDASLPSRLAAEERGDVVTTPATVGGLPQSTSPGSIDVDGTAFLREAEVEQQRAYAANLRFYEDILHPTQAGASPTTAPPGGELVWMQLPRFHENAPFSFFDLPPGKVGELKVLRSGRMVLEIAGVYYDIAVEGYEDTGNDGTCAMAVATQPSAYPVSTSSKASCYELGLLQKKLICTPTLQ